MAARLNAETGNVEVANRVTDDQGSVTMVLHIFPPETLEWRAAEYGIDPSDVDTLLDVVLAEPYDTEPAPLWQAPDRETARAALLDRVSARKASAPAARNALPDRASRVAALRTAGVGPDWQAAAEEEPRGALRRLVTVDPEVVAVMAEHVDRTRVALQRPPSRAQVSRADEWRRRLAPRQGAQRTDGR